MDNILLFICAISALFPVSSSAQRKYIYINEAKNWTEARSYCQEKFTDLATIENEEDMKELKDLATSLGKKDTAWIGLFYNVKSWSWSMSDSAFYQHKDFSNWALKQPDNHEGKENCGEMYSDGYWNDNSCFYQRESICSKVSGTDLKFVYINIKMSWTEAQSYCRKHHTDLASVRNTAENRQIMEVMPTPNVWIGLYREWKWVDGSHHSFTYWDTGNNQPNNNNGKKEDCAAIYLYYGKWHDWNCDAELLFICSRANSSTQFIFINEAKNWTEAQSYCRKNDSDLSIIKNMEDMNTLLNKAKSLGLKSAIWIGLYDDVNSWKWSMSDSDFYQQDEKEFRNWASGQPDNLHGQQYCTEMYYGGTWNDGSCSYEQHFICSDVNGANVKFVYINIKMSWTEAQSYCRKHHTDLASVRNMVENQQVVNVRPVSSNLAWIGLYRVPWKWVDGSNSSFRNWNEEPTLKEEDKCAAANFGNLGKWEDRKCDEKKPFFCYGVPFAENVMAVMQLKVSSADVTESAVRDDLLNQVRQKLKELRVDADLTWRKPLDKKAIEEQEEEENKKRNDEF